MVLPRETAGLPSARCHAQVHLKRDAITQTSWKEQGWQTAQFIHENTVTHTPAEKETPQWSQGAHPPKLSRNPVMEILFQQIIL